MIYTTKERNAAILLIGDGNADVSNDSLYEALEQFQWITISGIVNKKRQAVLTSSGKNLYKKLLNSI